MTTGTELQGGDIKLPKDVRQAVTKLQSFILERSAQAEAAAPSTQTSPTQEQEEEMPQATGEQRPPSPAATEADEATVPIVDEIMAEAGLEADGTIQMPGCAEPERAEAEPAFSAVEGSGEGKAAGKPPQQEEPPQKLQREAQQWQPLHRQ